MRVGGRTATLRLRGRAGPVNVDVAWPPRGRAAGPHPLILAIGVDSHAAAGMAWEHGRVVVRVASTTTLDDAVVSVRWAFAHHAELGASSDDLWVTGAGDGTATAHRVAARAARDGWPPLTVIEQNTPTDQRHRSANGEQGA